MRRRPRALGQPYSLWRLQRLADFMADEDQRDTLKPGEVFYYANEFNISWHLTLKAMWSPKAQQVMIPSEMTP